MCNPIHGIRFCTCEEVNEDGSMSYWQLHRNISGEQIITMGMPTLGYYMTTNRAPMLRRIRKALDSGSAFDFEYIPREGDHLSIHIVNATDGVPFESPMTEFGYVFKDGKWRYKAYDSFTWLWERVDVDMGCVGVKG
jgi:hypothetical protein